MNLELLVYVNLLLLTRLAYLANDGPLSRLRTALLGLARLKQLEDRDFAEYMLVGTLLSALSAVLVGFWIAGMAGVPPRGP